ncbi:MAG: hypothetical protein SFV19_06335 [Rhodospirillaceae bacterium]|nr:hypothetical protein [Rhodospirillaceae bacterium]
MSTAQVVNATMSSPAVRALNARGSVATGYQNIDEIDTGSMAARGRDEPRSADEGEDFEFVRRKPRRGEFRDGVISFAGVLVSRDVGTTIMQAQASLSNAEALISPTQAERNIAVYEFNQSLIGAPEAAVSVGVMH